MPAGHTYVALATQTVASATASVTFSSIPGTYTDLVIVSTPFITTGTTNFNIRFNSDAAGNYSWRTLDGNGSAASSNYDSNVGQGRLHDYAYLTTSNIGNYITSIQNYSNTTTYKTYLGRGSVASNGVSAVVGLWRSTAAITTIVLFPTASTFPTGSTFSLYGILAA